ncbi:hypothetical protein CAOG_000920 [Capsaspora owczarzaki ATCC 30864]|uniref:Uncharacterized protein n=1 Tax=Capsaspora owczarzaki (strain ATCC 30864) TaxID=595528 RepID=A0A0D2U2N5_CAPO3|nr:hypothetical protein CAOG_000920 [Capsaspora owczarzaki ATCC 30864]
MLTKRSNRLCDELIGVAEARAIAEALKANKTLREFRLSGNQIDDAGAQAIAEALKVNKTLTILFLDVNQIGDAGAQAIAEARKLNSHLNWINLRFNCIGNVGVQALVHACTGDSILTRLDIDYQINPLAFSLLPRFASAEDVQTVFHLLISGPELEDQSAAALPALPTEIAERLMNEAHYWQGVQHIKRLRSVFGNEVNDVLKVTVPENAIRVKAIQVLRERTTPTDSTGDREVKLIVRNDRCFPYSFTAKPTALSSTFDLLTIEPASHPIVGQIGDGSEVQVRFSPSAKDALFEALRVIYDDQGRRW